MPGRRGVRRVKAYAATTNAGKLAELRALFTGSLEIALFDRYEPPEETATTYSGNAAMKARALFEQLRCNGMRSAVIADDSGFEVAALGGRPGIYSARYGGADATWDGRRNALLAEASASDSSDRRARFVCAIHFIEEDGTETAVEGTVGGELASEAAGEAGFSYDPIFYYPPLGRTFAEIDAATKNRRSHRGIAAARLLAALGARTHAVRGATPVAREEARDGT